MKKYIAPSLKVRTIKVCTLMAGSTPTVEQSTGTTDNYNSLSKQAVWGDCWDEDEE